MNQQCKVCGEPAAGFHFGAFTCEGCKSFFGRSYNNLSSISECKNNGECVINKKSRTACKACRLRKCLLVGMSKSGSRYGRRSNWFKIHCLLQEQQKQALDQASHHGQLIDKFPQRTPPLHEGLDPNFLGAPSFPPSMLHLSRSKEELMLLGLDNYKHTANRPVSSPESHNSDSSVEVGDIRRNFPLFSGLLPSTFLSPPLLFPPGYSPLYPNIFPVTNNNNTLVQNHNQEAEALTKRLFLDTVLQSQRSLTIEEVQTTASAPAESSIQTDPMDLSIKTNSERGSSPSVSDSMCSENGEIRAESDSNEESDCETEKEFERLNSHHRPLPLDLSTKI